MPLRIKLSKSHSLWLNDVMIDKREKSGAIGGLRFEKVVSDTDNADRYKIDGYGKVERISADGDVLYTSEKEKP